MSDNAFDAFLVRWGKAGGSERANYQLFLTELCTLLELPLPEPAGDDTVPSASRHGTLTFATMYCGGRQQRHLMRSGKRGWRLRTAQKRRPE